MHHHDPGELKTSELDPGSKSLSDALRMSFNLLKLIIGVLVIVFIASAFFVVNPDEKALVLNLGKIRGIGEQRVLGPGYHFAWPGLSEIIKIPVGKLQAMSLDSFWYFQTDEEKVSGQKGTGGPTLNPLRDGYCITRNEGTTGQSNTDYNIVHAKFRLTYKISDPELFFKNVWVQPVHRGQTYSDVLNSSVKPLLQSISSGVVVTAMVKHSIDEAILSNSDIGRNIHRALQDKLDAINSGIKIESLQLTQTAWPRQVDDAFVASIKASQDYARIISEAGSYADNMMNETGGSVGRQIVEQVLSPTLPQDQIEALWKQLAGNAQEEIASAMAYRTSVVENAKANSQYLKAILPEYMKRPGLVVQKIYQDAIEIVLNNADEKIIVEPSQGNREVRIQVNRDPKIKPRPKTEN